MSTPEFKKMLYRDYSIAEGKAIIDLCRPVLIELVNYSCRLFMRCQASAKSAKNVDLPPLILFRHAIELTDGIETLLASCCSWPMVPLLRSSFETTLSLEYILKDNFENRSLSWLYSYLRHRKEELERYDYSTPRGMDLRKEVEKQFGISSRMATHRLTTKPNIKNIDSLLSSTQFAPIVKEFNSVRKTMKGRKPEWFMLFGGPANRRVLADKLGKTAEYDLLYKSWSSMTHAGDMKSYFTTTNTGQPAFWALRNPEPLRDMVNFASTFLLRCIRTMTEKYRHGEDIKKWYVDSVQENWKRALNTKISVSPVEE